MIKNFGSLSTQLNFGCTTIYNTNDFTSPCNNSLKLRLKISKQRMKIFSQSFVKYTYDFYQLLEYELKILKFFWWLVLH